MERNRDEFLKDSGRDLETQKRLEELKSEYNVLNEQRIKTGQHKESLEEQLKTLKDKAQREYGTSDIEELRQLLEKRRKENDRKVDEYQMHINQIKSQLAAIEKAEATQE